MNFHPNLTTQLVYYQSLICQFSPQYTFAAWSTYDRLFRYQLAHNTGLGCDHLDDDLFNRNIRGHHFRCYVTPVG